MRNIKQVQPKAVLMAMAAILVTSAFNTAHAYSISTAADVYRFNSSHSDHSTGTNYAYASDVFTGYHSLSASASAGAGSLSVNANLAVDSGSGYRNAEVSAGAHFSDIFSFTGANGYTPAADIYATVHMAYTLGWNSFRDPDYGPVTSMFSTADTLASLSVSNQFSTGYQSSMINPNDLGNAVSGAHSGDLFIDVLIYRAQTDQWSDLALNMHLGTSRLFAGEGTTSSFSGSAYLAGIIVPGEIDFTSSSNVLATPVPAAAWLFASGLIGLIGVARRKNA